jgi:striatin 1/3/4
MLGSVQNLPQNKGPSIIQQQSQLPQPQQPQNGPTDVPPPPLNGQDFTLSNVLHFLQSEWRKYERDRNEWEIERAEMRVRRPTHYLVLPSHPFMFFQARIALLEGERRSFENIKVDLMRRIKMLEYALRVERCVPLLSSTVSRGLTRFPRAAQSNSRNQAPSHPSRFPPQRLLLCSLLHRRMRHLAIKKAAVPAPLEVKVFRFLFIPFPG